MLFFQSGNVLSIADIVGLIGLFLTGFGLIFTALQLRQNNITRRSETLVSIINQYFSDASQRKMFYKLDYNKFQFNPETFTGSDDEQALDGILYNLDVIGKLLRIGAITLEEARIFEFEAQRVFSNKEVIKYLDWFEKDIVNLDVNIPFQNAQYLSEQLLNKTLSAVVKNKKDSSKDAVV